MGERGRPITTSGVLEVARRPASNVVQSTKSHKPVDRFLSSAKRVSDREGWSQATVKGLKRDKRFHQSARYTGVNSKGPHAGSMIASASMSVPTCSHTPSRSRQMRTPTLSVRSHNGIGAPATNRRRPLPRVMIRAVARVSAVGVHGWPARQAARCRATWNAGRGLHRPSSRPCPTSIVRSRSTSGSRMRTASSAAAATTPKAAATTLRRSSRPGSSSRRTTSSTGERCSA